MSQRQAARVIESSQMDRHQNNFPAKNISCRSFLLFGLTKHFTKTVWVSACYRANLTMADPPTPGASSIPSAISVSKPSKPDHFHPVPIEHNAPPSESESRPLRHDYTENAPQADVDAVASARWAKEDQEGPPDMMVGSLPDWTGNDKGRFRCNVFVF